MEQCFGNMRVWWGNEEERRILVDKGREFFGGCNTNVWRRFGGPEHIATSIPVELERELFPIGVWIVLVIQARCLRLHTHIAL